MSGLSKTVGKPSITVFYSLLSPPQKKTQKNFAAVATFL